MKTSDLQIIRLCIKLSTESTFLVNQLSFLCYMPVKCILRCFIYEYIETFVNAAHSNAL